MTNLERYPTRVGKLLSTGVVSSRHGVTVTNHFIVVPVDYADPAGDRLTVFVRELSSGDITNKPALLYLQGGPGFGSPKPELPSGWIAEALKNFRVFLLDQRGTGMSTPVTAHLGEQGTPQGQADYLAHFRADNIVRDAEAFRELFGIDHWYTLGQSFGGFCTLTYLSLAPESLAGCLITGGIPGLDNTADEVYRRTYPATASRWKEYLTWYPRDQVRLNELATRVAEGDVFLPSGEELTVPRLQQLGMFLGGNARIDQLHYLLEDALLPDGKVHPRFLDQMFHTVSFASAPLYAVLHESIYAQGTSTRWAADRVRKEFPEFRSDASNVIPTAEHLVRDVLFTDPGLKGLADAAQLLAEKKDWPFLYDLDQLSSNAVPVAAAVYTNDIYVPQELSLRTAQRIPHLQVWESVEHHHDGLRADGQIIFQQLAQLISLPGYQI